MKKPKKIEFEFDEYIKDINELIKQLDSLKMESLYMTPFDEIFKKDHHALRIIVRYLREVRANEIQ